MSRTIGRSVLLALAVALIAAAASVPFFAAPHAGIDDGLFARLAMNILHTGWLGPYDQFTLVKGPFYPLFLAASSLTGLPFLAVQAAVYAAASLLLAWAIGLLCGSFAIEFACGAALLLNPILFGMDLLHVTREGIYVPLTILVVALALLCHARRDSAFAHRSLLALATGLALGAFWLTREEGVWLLPPLLLIAAAALASTRRTFAAIASEVAVIGLVAATAAACVGGVRLVNFWQYGVHDVVELKQPAFVDAYAALMRIDGPELGPHEHIGWQRLDQAFAASPAAAELEPVLRAWGPSWARASCTGDGPSAGPCDGEIHDAWMIWALHGAAAAVGHHRTAVDARAFYRRMADELNAACDARRIACGPERHSLLPPFGWNDAAPAFLGALRMAGAVTTLKGGWWQLWRTMHIWLPPLPPVSCLVPDAMPICRTDGWFFDLAHMSLFTQMKGQLDPDETDMYWKAQRDSAQLPSVGRALHVVAALYWLRVLLSAVLPWASGLATLSYVGAGLLRIARGGHAPALFLCSLAALVIASRIGLLAVIDATMFYTETRVIYLSPIYPFLLLFCVLGTASLWQAGAREDLLSRLIGVAHRTFVVRRRASVLARQLAAVIPAEARTVLDVGCGDGMIDVLVKELRPELAIAGIDVALREQSHIPVQRFDGMRLPFADGAFDVVMFVDVLHHTEDPLILMREARRVARLAIVLKDHTLDGAFAYTTLSFMDLVGNARHGVALPNNYWPDRRWRAALAELGLPIAEWRSRLGLYPFPASLLFERRLHFVARIGCGEAVS